MNADTRHQKVLRIGIIQDGKLVQERFVKHGDPVTVGESPKNTFVFPKTSIEQAEFTLFAYRGQQYHLRLTEGMKGKMHWSGAQVAIDQTRTDGQATVEEGAWSIPLTEHDKGKIDLQGVSILFRFDAPPAQAASTQQDKFDFRPRFIEDDDPIFLGFLAICMAIGVLFTVYANNVEVKEISFDDERLERFTRIIVAKPVEETPPVLETSGEQLEASGEKDDTKPASAEEAPEPSKAKVSKADPNTAAGKAQAHEERKSTIVQSSALFQQMQIVGIGTTGENARGSILGTNTQMGADADMAARLAAAGAAGVAIGDGSAIRGGSGVAGGTGDRTVGTLQPGAVVGTAVDIGAAPTVRIPKGNTSIADIDMDGGDVAGVKGIVNKYRGNLNFCYEQALKVNPSLKGRVVVKWSVVSEAAEDVYVVENGTGDEAFETCIKDKIKRWKFTGVEDGDVKNTFMFVPED